MNYLRGAVSAISAPYYYYNQINPSTLTGAIDVIVVRYPSNGAEPELACSPFHVRFGKWQVLRPSDKRVNVSVNGNQIPYAMKIGEAGEAFFIFETDEDVPENLVTSPLLQPTLTEGELAATTPAAGSPDDEKSLAGVPEANGPSDLKRDEVRPRVTSEPEYLDLDALPDGKTPKPANVSPAYAPIGTASGGDDDRSAAMDEQDKRVDEVLARKIQHRVVPGPDIEYRKDVALDVTGYHAPGRTNRVLEKVISPSAEQTPSDSEQEPPPRSTTPSPSSSPNLSDSGNSTRRNSFKFHPFPSFRAVSEPPPDIILTPADGPSHTPSETLIGSSFTSPGPSSPAPTPPLQIDGHEQEYSWEWGGFPTPSPMKATFPSMKGKERQDDAISGYFGAIEEEGDEADDEDNATDDPRSKSWRKWRRKSQGKYRLDNGVGLTIPVAGQLRADETDTTRFILDVGGTEVSFELSLVDQDAETCSFHDLDKAEAAGAFDNAKVPFQNFLDDEAIVKDVRLIMRWASCRYTTRHDNAPLMHALESWRANALQQRRTISEIISRPEETRQTHASSMSEESDEVWLAGTSKGERRNPKASKLSWVPWWSRSRKNSFNLASDVGAEDRPPLRGSATAPPTVPLHPHEVLKTPKPMLRPELEAPMPLQLQPVPPKKRYVKTLRLTSEQLKTLNLKPGTNNITFSLSASGAIACTARIFVWDSTDQVVISDIDGTITKSDGLGHVFAMIGRDWTHFGVAKLYSDIVRNGYKILYLTSRAIGQADATRYYLKGIRQNDYQLPEGPVIMSPDRLMASLHREVIMRKPEVFKMACLRDIRNLFGEANRNPFYAGFGNRITDALSYRSVAVPSSRIFTIDTSGEVRMELLEVAGYKSSYIHMTDLVDQMFPPINKKWMPEYTDFNYWRTPIPDILLPDLTPPSPALSARSDGSTRSALARLRNFSLVGSRQAKSERGELGVDDSRRNVHARLSSLERLSSSLVDGFRRSISPDSRSESSATYATSDADSDGEGGIDTDGKRRRKLERRQSIGSMPGSLDDMHFFGLDDYEEGQLEEPVFGEFEEKKGEQHEGDYHDDGELHEGDAIADEQALEEDLFVAGQMQNVPFL